jgi:protoheme IX farnesyltransferase
MKRIKQPTKTLFAAYTELSKPKIMSLVLITTVLGYYLGGNGIESWLTLTITLIGTALSSGGAGALNHYLE